MSIKCLLIVLLCISNFSANAISCEELRPTPGYDVPENYDWLKFLNKPENAIVKEEALSKLTTLPSKEYVDHLKNSIVSEVSIATDGVKLILGDDKKEVEYVGFNRACEIRDYEINGSNPFLKMDKDFKVNVRYYEGKKYRNAKEEDRRTLLLIPPTGGFSIIDKAYASSFCRSYPIRVLVLKGWIGDKNAPRPDDLDEAVKMLKVSDIDPLVHDIGAVNSILSIKLMIKFLETNEPLAIMGNSVGGITSVLAMGIIDQIMAGVSIVAGAEQEGIISRSGERKLTVLRGVRSSLIGSGKPVGVSEYEDVMEKFVHIRPRDYFYNILEQKKPLFMVTGLKDITVPTCYQKKQEELLEEVVGGIIEKKKDHLGTIASSVSKRAIFAQFIIDNIKKK